VNIAETLKNASETLRANEVGEPRREAAALLAFALRKNKTFLIAYPEYEIPSEEENLFREFVRRRSEREPLQYITGKQEFYGLDFSVTKDVLIPRPETEILVEAAIEILRNSENPFFCEVGTGSGCIAVSILHEVQNARATGLEISENALEITKTNAQKHRVSNRLDLRISDVFEVLCDETFDLIVSNPPYISLEEIKNLQAEVQNFEPLVALTDGKDGLSIIEKVIREAPKFLKPDGFLLLEIGFAQSRKVLEMADKKIWREVDFLPDLQGIPRIFIARKSASVKI
jgi:release factor glutamine methyltransferase